MKRTQIICIGASSLYGVGGTKGGWADMLKRYLHERMYGNDGLGEEVELYNLGVPGAKLKDIYERLDTELTSMQKPNRQPLIVLHTGFNDARADNLPDNYFSSVEDYRKICDKFLLKIKSYSENVICLGGTPMNPDKVMPKSNPFNDKKTYFDNQRIKLFENTLGECAYNQNIEFIPLFENASNLDWYEKYQWSDGCHPNDLGHKWIYDQIAPKIIKALGN